MVRVSIPCDEFSGRGMHDTWLVEDVEVFPIKLGAASRLNRRLPFGVTYEEWFSLFFEILSVDKTGFERWAAEHPEEAANSVIGEFSEEIPEFPLLSRINSTMNDIVFEREEVPDLQSECRQVLERSRQPLAGTVGLQKLICAAEMALESDLNLYLLGP